MSGMYGVDWDHYLLCLSVIEDSGCDIERMWRPLRRVSRVVQ